MDTGLMGLSGTSLYVFPSMSVHIYNFILITNKLNKCFFKTKWRTLWLFITYI